MRRKATRFGIWFGVAGVSVWCIQLFLCAIVRTCWGYSETDFESGGWKRNWWCGCTPVRMQMAPDLVAGQQLLGMTRAQVTEVLGEPDPDAYAQKFEQPGTFVYHLAPMPFADDFWLFVRFDATDHVREAELGND